MGTETKFNCYTKNTKTVDIPKLIKNSIGSPTATHNNSNIITSSSSSSSSSLSSSSSTSCSSTSYKNGHSHNNNKYNNNCMAVNGKDTQKGPIKNAAAIAFVPIHIDENNVIDGAKEILKVIRPNWNLNAVEFKNFTDGITNKLVGCFYSEPPTTTNALANGKNSNSNSNDDSTQIPNVPTTSSLLSTTSANSKTITNGQNHHSFDDKNDSGNPNYYTNETDKTVNNTVDDELQENTTTTTSLESNTNNVVLVRVYGNKTDLLIDRKAETRNIKLLQSYGFAPSLYATFKNGLVYDYVPGITLNSVNILKPEVWRLVACCMAKMHRVVKMDDALYGANEQQIKQPMLWRKTQSFFDLVPDRFSDAEKHKRIESTFLPISRMRKEFETLYRHLETLDSPLVFAHNDLLLGNVVYTESRQTVTFIDYEYADYNFQAFDIGNHFAEFAGVDEVDYALYPKRDFQMEWLRVYLQTYLQRQHITDEELQRLYVQVNQFALAAHFFWSIWCLIQAEHSTIDFDYVDYAFERYNEYLAKKDEFLALKFDATKNGSS